MASNRMRRVAKELADIVKDKSSQIQVEPIGDHEDITRLRGSFPGPPDTPYQGGTYSVDIKIPTDYPFRPPLMKFETKVWHPNISSQTGAICLDTLGTAWSPVLTTPQDAEVATMMLQAPQEFERVARQWAVTYAGAPSTGTGSGNTGGANNAQLSAPKDDIARYGGYNRDLVSRFTDMGFDLEQVVSALRFVGINTNGGQPRELEDAQLGDITARLLGD
ncbi:hypothetical protein N7526_006057 [Penicillium atrosanguineum]|nr:hypothetical protein N7526_006057 [Penicillium atrosanguineum]